MRRNFFLVLFCYMLGLGFAKAQTTDSTSTVTDTAANKANIVKPPKQKEIKKLDDPLLALSSELMYRLKKMTPNQLLVIDERSVRNEKRVDDAGQEYEVTITVRLGFSQDMITGIVKEVPLYQSNDKEPNILHVKIPVKFCCITPIDTLHTKRHCGKMSELNDFEDKEHCKDWAQQDEAAEAAANAGGFGKPGGSRTSKKKGGDVTGKTNATGEEEEFGKPVPKGKKSGKKGKNGKDKVEEEEVTSDSTKSADKYDIVDSTKKESKAEKIEKKKSSDEEGFGKPQPKSKAKKKGKNEVVKEKAEDVDQQSTDSTVVKEAAKPSEKKEKKDKSEKVEKKKDADEEGFGKPEPKSKGKKKGKPEPENEDSTIADIQKEVVNEQPADSTSTPNKEPVKSSSKKDKKKKG